MESIPEREREGATGGAGKTNTRKQNVPTNLPGQRELVGRAVTQQSGFQDFLRMTAPVSAQKEGSLYRKLQRVSGRAHVVLSTDAAGLRRSRQTDRQTGRETDRQTDRQAGRLQKPEQSALSWRISS